MVDYRNTPVEDLIRSQLQGEEEFTDQRSSHFSFCAVSAKLEPASSKDNEIFEINVLQKFTSRAVFFKFQLGISKFQFKVSFLSFEVSKLWENTHECFDCNAV